MEESDFYRTLNKKALLPFERLKGNGTHGSPRDNPDVFYLDILKSSICKNSSDEALKKYCRLNNLEQKDLDKLFSEDLDNRHPFPEWMDTLEKSLRHININTVPFTKETERFPFYQLLSPFVEYSFFLFSENASAKGIEQSSQRLIGHLKKVLFKELLIISYAVFKKEFSAFLDRNKEGLNNKEENFYYKKFILKNLEDKLETIFLKFPVLARLIATKVYRYSNFIANLFERFTKDKKHIERFFEVKLSAVKNVHLNAGDLHNGEATVILEFSNRHKLVYKPTDISITLAYNQFLCWINTNLNENLKTFKVLHKSNYGWMEFVEARECKTLKDVKTYYKRAGILSGAAYFLNSRDYHFENVIASGNSPVLIDHETIIGPEIKQYLENGKSRIINTILESMLLPSYEDNITKKCGFGSIKQYHGNNRSFVVYRTVNCNKDNMEKIRQTVTKKTELNHIPKKDNEPQFIENYQPDFFKGLKILYNLVLKNKAFLVSEKSPLKDFENTSIRHIIRPTKVYGKMLALLNKPQYLKDATIYGLKMEMLARAYITYDGFLNIDLLKSEREQMVLGDIPVFYTKSTSKHLELPNGGKAHLFEKSAIENIKENIGQATMEDLGYQISVLNEVLPQNK